MCIRDRNGIVFRRIDRVDFFVPDLEDLPKTGTRKTSQMCQQCVVYIAKQVRRKDYAALCYIVLDFGAQFIGCLLYKYRCV